VFTEEEFNRALMSSRSSGERIPVIVRRDTGRTTMYIDPQMIRQSFAFSRGGADTDIGVTLMTGAEDRLIVQNVTGGIAARLGLRPNDVIVTVGGRRIASPAQFERIFHDVGFVDGRELPVVVFRNGRRVTLYFEPEIVQYRNRDRDYYRGEQEAWLGVTLNTNYQDYAVVQRVVPNSSADEAGVQPGDWIVRLNGRRVNSPSHLTSLVRSMEPGEELEIQVARRVSRTLMARLDASRPEPPRQALRPSYEEFQDFDDADLWQEERRLDGPDALEQFQPDLDRRGLRDRIGPGERGLRDRLDRDEVRDEPRGVLPR
jgi:C-terminal processing protease CtpA/Prc